MVRRRRKLRAACIADCTITASSPSKPRWRKLELPRLGYRSSQLFPDHGLLREAVVISAESVDHTRRPLFTALLSVCGGVIRISTAILSLSDVERLKSISFPHVKTFFIFVNGARTRPSR